MADSTPPCSIPFSNLIQLKKKIITVSGSSIVIRKGVNANMIKEKQIFTKSRIHRLISIGGKSDDKAVFLALSSKRIALFQLKEDSPIAIFKLDEKIVDHGTVEVLDMETRNEGEFRVRLIIPIAFYSGTVRKMQLNVDFRDSQIAKQKMKCLGELRMEDEKMRFCVDLGSDEFIGFYEDTVVKSDGLVTRAEEPSAKKKRRIAVVARELWQGNVLLATENGTIRVVRATNGGKIESDSLTLISEGQCVPPYCTLRCKEPSVLLSTENIVIVGTQRGEVHFLNEKLKLLHKIDTEGGPINCLKVDENCSEFLWAGFESGELRMLFMPDKKKERTDQVFGGRCKRSGTDIVCPFCDYKTLVTHTFLSHLKKFHNTNLALAGLVFLCQCGNESVSSTHSQKCYISNFTVVRKEEFGPIRTFADKMTPKCILCKAFPRSINGYAEHLLRKHKKHLEETGYSLKCGVCEGVYFTRATCGNHTRKCKSRFYSLNKLIKTEEMKEEATEMDQTADA